MRILFCTNSLGSRGGIERVTIVKTNALADIDGNTVGICYTDKGTFPNDVIHPLSSKVMTFDLGVSFWDLYPLNPKNLLITAPKKFLKLRKSLKKLIETFNPDIVVTTGSYEKYALASLRLKRTVKIREYHFNSNYRHLINASPIIKIAGFIDNHMLCRCFDSNWLLTKEDLTNFKDSVNFEYQHNPCSFSQSIDHIVERSNVIAAVGRLVDQKNFASLIRSFSKIANKIQDWELWIVGDGDQRNMLENMVERLDVSSQVKFLGFSKDVDKILSNASILAMTSKYEGLPLNLLEAMHCGAVPITFATPYGPTDIITDGVDGVLVDYMDEDQFAVKLLALISDSKKLNQMSKSAINRAKDFNPDTIVEQVMTKYKHLLNQKHKL